MSVNSVFALLAIITAGFMRMALKRTNRQIASGEKTVAQAMKGKAQAEISGLTHAESEARREEFRYIA